ncbi:MAG: hypothetical protein JXO44_04900 [Clostridia bacterium]|nr:hypothetical protein [Clostridia bacterium]
MKRDKKLVLLAHCIMNQNSVVYPLARAKGGFKNVITTYLNENYGIYQLPCPELRYLGLTRKPMTKEDYDSEAYRTLCHKLAEEVMEDLRHYRDDQVTIAVLHGVNHSPTCSITGRRGHFMDILLELLEKENFELEHREISTSYEE